MGWEEAEGLGRSSQREEAEGLRDGRHCSSQQMNLKGLRRLTGLRGLRRAEGAEGAELASGGWRGGGSLPEEG